MVAEVAALKLELNQHSLPFTWGDLTFSFTVWESSWNGFHQVTQFLCHHPEEQDHPLLIHGGMPQMTKVNWITIDWAVG